jgi:hypothetical protein
MAAGGTTGISRGGIIAAIVDTIRSSPTIVGMTVIITTGTTIGAASSIVIIATGITIGMATSLAARVVQAVVGPAMVDRAMVDRAADVRVAPAVLATVVPADGAIVETAVLTDRSSPTLINSRVRVR